MRVIGGFLKGKRIDFLKSATTRPLRDFVKENIFNIIRHSKLIDVSLENVNILDLYSGVGSFGIECISSGAKKVTFVESNKEVLEVLKKNIEQLKIEKKSKIFETKIISFCKNSNKDNKFDIIFLDPPFSENFFIQDLKIIKNLNIYKDNHLIVIHRESRSNDNLSGIINILIAKKYGRSKILFGNFNEDTV
jgi:16S rRNA (guanine966-N2)-methyltransferase|tara:strand:+ start:1284 stop:1859 length:576 start_codon:yes stop_codon:yes gene_type:complete